MDKESYRKEEQELEIERKKLEEQIKKLKEEQIKLNYLNKNKRVYRPKVNLDKYKSDDNINNNYKDAYYEDVSNQQTQPSYDKMNNKKIGALIILVIIISFICGFLGSLLIVYYDKTPTNTIKNTKSVTITETNSISDAVEKVYDSVVVVESYKDNQLYSTGTGFVYKKENKKAYIMTNNHVIEGGENTKVLFNDGTEMETKIVGADTYSDIAVLSIDDKDNIKIASLGKTEGLKAGDTVFAVGSPEGSEYAGTVTKGVLSAKERLVEVALSGSNSSDYYMKVIQTDAAINPGNSGGPLCNAIGEVIGITNMKLVDDSVEGMGFAIPIEDALTYAQILETEGKIARPYIGISMLDITDSYYLWQAGIMLPENITEGVAIYSVENNSPAKEASLQKGDIITEISGTKISSVAKFRYELYKHKVGETIELTINRNGKTQKVKLKLSQNSN